MFKNIMENTYKLTYFNGRALGEPARITFAYAGVPFEDIRIPHDDKWSEIKAKYPWGTLPVLEVNGKVLAQSAAIIRYLGKQFNLAGEDDFEAAQCDEMIEAMTDLKTAAAAKTIWTKDEDETTQAEKKRVLIHEVFPKFLIKWSEISTKNGGFLVGKKLSIADFCVASYLQIFDEILDNELVPKYPEIGAHLNRVFNAPGIKEWVASRPKTFW